MHKARGSLSDKLRAAGQAALRAVYDNRAEFHARLAASNISVFYDPDFDYCQLWVWPREPSVVLEVDATLWLKVATDASRLLGLEIPDIPAFVDAYPPHGAKLMRPIEQMDPAQGEWVALCPSTRIEVAAALRELLPA
jgi:hypothetical protein